MNPLRSGWVLFCREFRDATPLLAALCAGVATFGGLLSATYPTARANFEQMTRFVPSFLRPLLPVQAGPPTFERYIAIAFGHPVLLGLFGAWVLTRASQAVGWEVARGGLGWLLSYPIGRRTFLAVKIVVMLLGTALMCIALFAGIAITLTAMHLPHTGPGPYLAVGTATWLLFTAIGAIALWISAGSSEAGPPARWGTLLLLGGALLDDVAKLWNPLRPIHWLSPFAWYAPQPMLAGANLSPKDVTVLAGAIAIGLAMAMVTFLRRDLSI